ncbi:5-(carboxyamino)imidazole ribonucleotide synthase [Porifericola rhodea]|uniref:5-(carboxyamino)imidazole ribonucleotide synthase n=1 Tax=Porifericola rhodea TaxID=930972 RepID=UPI002665FF12|nr:5-(carboxyamino)imidazole ribonucleotide synthase [Porifericola rhodea]WKN33114.1 5-(carboxyamino)imidazole ribonucleotide synthase [Porifericola rhodea]
MSAAFYQNFKLGVLGGGQLGRMLIQSAIDFNLDVWVLDPDENAPCKNIATHFTQGALTDFDTVYTFGKQCDLITIEIENVNTAALKKLKEEGIKVYPEPEIIELIQDKREQKTFYQANGIPTADFVLTENRAEVAEHTNMLPAVHKLGKEGYDGRGVQIIATEQDLPKAFDKPGLLEKQIAFEKELAVIVARNARGEMKTFPVVELVFHPEHNLVEYLFAPANISQQIAKDADQLAQKVIEKLGMTGLLAVEMFLTKEGELLVNEVAPRTHNSGHHSIEANITSQFEQHLRAILNMPLGATATKIPAAMVNLLGEDGFSGLAKLEGFEETLAIEGVKVHLYGKKYTKPFRKMGHITIIDKDVNLLKKKVEQVKNSLKIKA